MSNIEIGNLKDSYLYIEFVGKTDSKDIYHFSQSATSSFRTSVEGFSAPVSLELQDSQGKVLKKISTTGTNTGTISIDNLGAADYSLLVSPVGLDTNYSISLTPNGKVDPLTGLGVDSGFFTTDQTGQVGWNLAHDGGFFQGEAAIFSLDGMEKFKPSSPEFIKEAAKRALSNSVLGHVVFSDATEGANPAFDGGLGEDNFNSGPYKGQKTFDMTPGKAFAVMLVPDGTVKEVFNNPNIGGNKRPLFSLSSLNPKDAWLFGQVADITGDGKAFAMEDQRADGESDKDYNDVIFLLSGATGKAVPVEEVISLEKDWTHSEAGQKLINYVKSNLPTHSELPVTPKPIEEKPPVSTQPPSDRSPEIKPPIAIEKPIKPIEEKPPLVAQPPSDKLPEEKPPVAIEEPIKPIAEEPPVVAQPPSDKLPEEKPPVVIEEPIKPITEKPPVATQPPSDKSGEKPPVAIEEPIKPIAEKPPVTDRPPSDKSGEKPPVVMQPSIEPTLPIEPPIEIKPTVEPQSPVDEVGYPVEDTQPTIDVPSLEPKLPFDPWGNSDRNLPVVGIFDTGFAKNNPDLDKSKVIVGRDRVDNDSDPFLSPGDGNEHGTHIWGIISATQGNDIGIDGLNDRVPIYLSRVIGSGDWDLALNDFVQEVKAQGRKNAIANLSLDLTQKNADGSITTRYEFTPRERASLENARQNGVLLVVATGNDGGVMSVLGQASQEFDNIITVGAFDGFGRSSFSSYGPGLDLVVASGTIENPTLSTVGDSVGTMAGTSVAVARATGIASLVWEKNPDLSYRQVIDILKSSAIDVNTPGWDEETGSGILHRKTALKLAEETAPQPYTPEPFSNPTTWGKEGQVTPIERATNFSAAINQNKISVQINEGVNIRSEPNTNSELVGKITTGQELDFDKQQQGELIIDPNGEGSNDLWYHLADGRGWVSALYIGDITAVYPPPNQNPDPINPKPPPSNSISINGYTIGGNFYPVFQKYQATLGNPNSDVKNYNGVSYQTFEKGSIISSSYGTFPLYGGIRQAFLSTGGLEGWLGAPKSEEKGLGNGNIIQYFENGHIYWNGSKAIAYQEGDGQSNHPNFGDNTPTIGGDLSSIPDSISAKRAVSGGGIVDSHINGSFAKDVVDAVKRGVIREEVGLFVMSILATESGGGNWQANNGLGYLGAFQMGKNERQAFAPGVSDEEFLANKDIQLKAAQGLYDEKLRIIQNKAQTGELHLWTTEPDLQPLDAHFAGKSNIYKAAYAWLNLAGEDGNNVYSKDYAQAADESATLINQTLGLNKGPISTDEIQQPSGTPLLTPVGLDYFNSRPEFYTTGNRFWKNGSAPSGLGNSDNTGTLGNCTWYAFGRAKELGGSEAALTGMSEEVNAGSWGDRVQAGYAPGAQVVSTPQVGDIAEWIPSQFGNSQYGHVAVVEQVNADGSILISQSSYPVGNNSGYLHRSSDQVPGYLPQPAHFIRVPRT